MKIKTKILTKFLDKVMMTEGQEIREAVFKFENDGLKIDANSGSKQTRVMGWLKKDAFTQYDMLGNIGLNDLSNVVKVLGRFGEEIAIKKEGNLLTVSGDGKKVDIELVSENFLDQDTGAPTLQFEDTFTMQSSKAKEIFKDVKMNKDAIMTIETMDKKVIFSNTGKYKFRNELKADTCKGGVKVKFGDPLIEAMANLDNNLDISVRTDYPMRVVEKTDESVINIIIAPRIEDN
jgi:hypothetical protein